MKNFKYFVIVLMALGIAACSRDTSIKPVSSKINGPLGKYFEVVDRNYVFNQREISIEFRRIAEGGPEDASWTTHPTFTTEILDKNGNTIDSKSTDVVWTREQLETVFNLGIDETASITFKFDKTEGTRQVKVLSKWDVEKDSDNHSSADDGDDLSEDLSESSSSTDWDELLDEYEEYVDDYVRVYKKTKNGDVDALRECSDILERAQDVYSQMSDASDMTAAQLNRMNEIHQKMLKSM